MYTKRWMTLAAGAALALSASSAAAQRPGGGMGGRMGGGMGGDMMGMRHDSATRAQMADIHELVMNHGAITRTVTNLADGVRTVTESADPRLAQVIKDHVGEMIARVRAGDDPMLPMESPALRTLFRNGDRVRTVVDSTATGTVVVQTSSDPETIAALQQHAAEVTKLVEGGRAAMHEAMMRNRGGGGMRMGAGPPR